MVGGDVYLFMTQRPSVVSGGHGNTCPGPFSAALACGLCWPCQSLQLLQLLGSPPSLSLSVSLSFLFLPFFAEAIHFPPSCSASPFFGAHFMKCYFSLLVCFCFTHCGHGLRRLWMCRCFKTTRLQANVSCIFLHLQGKMCPTISDSVSLSQEKVTETNEDTLAH